MEEHLYKLEDFERFYEMTCEHICKQNQITPTGLQIIYFLGHHPDKNTAKEICQYRCIKNSIVSMTIDKLVRGGYLIRNNDRKDRRIQRLQITEKAQPIVVQGDELVQDIKEAVLKGFTNEEKETLFEMLERIHHALQEMMASGRSVERK